MAERDSERQEPHGRLGRLFAALVGTDASAAPGPLAPEPGAADAGGGRPALDLDELTERLAASADPMGALRALVADVRGRAERGGEGAPSGLEVFLAERLAESGIMGGETGLPSVRVVRPHTSGLFYLRIEEPEITWASKISVLRAESALNAALLATHALRDARTASLEELVRCEQRVARSIVAQAPQMAARAQAPAVGEWDIREAISLGIESLRLPHRLTARFRVNASRGMAAIEADLTPPRAWPATAYVDGLGVVGATTDMRRRAASDYNLRLGLLLASYALLVAPELDQVWVAGVVDNPSGHACYYSARVDRALVDSLDLDGPLDPWAVMRDAGATMEADAGELAAVHQGFSLDDELFCPPRRFEPVELSPEALPLAAAEALGGRLVRDLGSDEAAGRRRASEGLLRSLGDSTSDDVRALLSVANAPGAEKSVRDAALWTVHELVGGTLDDDALVVAEAFVDGGTLVRVVRRAREDLLSGRFDEAAREVEGALAPLDGAGAYTDGDELVWRVFGDHTERVLYNLLVDEGGREVALAPTAYLEAHLMASAARLALEDLGGAVAHARRARELAPVSAQVSLHLAQCLEATGDLAGAGGELRRMLGLAHDQESLGLGFLRMSQLQWAEGRVLAAQACYQRACRHLGGPALVAGLAVVALLGQVGSASDGSLTPEQADAALAGAGVPQAPTEELLSALAGAARAAVSSEHFDVARDVVRSLCSVARDDVSFGVLRSLEGEPDR